MFTRLAFFLLLLAALPARAAEGLAIGAPTRWGLDLQEAFSPMKHKLHDFHDMLLIITIAISVFVMALLAYVMLRYNARRNPVPQNFAHNTLIEVIWTAVPVLILIVIAIPSFKLLYYLDKTPDPEMTLKVTGHQWYWSYEYPDHRIERFESRPVWDGTKQEQAQIDTIIADARPGWLHQNEALRLLEVDNRVVLPINTRVRIDVTAADVLHAWAMPALGIKKDAVPGRLNETWLEIEREGVYYGQCSELCGTGHGFMPIVIEGVSKERFAEWVKTKATPEEPPPAPSAKPPAQKPAAEKEKQDKDARAVDADPAKAPAPAAKP